MHIGQKVEFIGPGKWVGWPPHLARPLHGVVYTVRSLYIDPFYGAEGIRLNELSRETICGGGHTLECGWARHEFRSIVELKTDISVFTKMLQPELV